MERIRLKEALDQMKSRPANIDRPNSTLCRILVMPLGNKIDPTNVEKFMDGQMDALSEEEAALLMTVA